jgi:hypothetical protein
MSATDPTATPLDRHASPVRARGQVPGMAIAAFVLGIIAIPTALFIVPGAICAIVGLVLGLTSRGNAKRSGDAIAWQATWGAALSVVALVIVAAIIAIAAAS